MKDEKLRKSWKQDAEGVRHDILMVAMEEFAEHGLAGARIDEIAEKTRTSKRMIYYYFGDKDGLYLAALEAAYARMRAGEEKIDTEGLDPRGAMKNLVRFVFDQNRENPNLVRMVMSENVNRAAYLQKSEFIRDLSLTLAHRLQQVLEQGQSEGVFRQDFDPCFLHWHIMALSFFNISNRPSYSMKFGDDLFGEDRQIALREEIVDSVMRMLRPDPDPKHA